MHRYDTPKFMPQPDRSLPRPKYPYQDGSITTRHGRFDFESPELVDIRDIAYGLSSQVRYVGQTPEPYSIAQHSVACAKLVEYWGECRRTQLAALMHDAAEAYCGDLTHVLRQKLESYNEVVSRVEALIAEKFNYPFPHPPAAQKADRNLYGYERRSLARHPDIDVSEIPAPPPPVSAVLSEYWSPDHARDSFLEAFHRLI